MEKSFPNNLSMQEILRLANSPAGKQLIAMMQQQGGGEFQKAMASAATGDYSQARQAIEALMTDPKAQQLLKQLGG